MSVAAAIRELLMNNAAVAAAMGLPAGEAGAGSRIVSVAVPQKLPRPNVVIQVLGTRRQYSNDGPVSTRRATVQVSCYADDYDTAAALAAAVGRPHDHPTAPGLDGYSGPAAGGVSVGSLFIDDEVDAPTPSTPGAGGGVPGVVLSLAVAYSE